MSEKLGLRTLYIPDSADRQEYAAANAKRAVITARANLHIADHYNDFRVTAFAIASSAKGRVKEFVAGNTNREPGENWSKACAEGKILRRVESQGFDHIELLAVAGMPQADTHSRIETPCLQCCGNCRGACSQSPLVTEATHFVFAHAAPELNRYQLLNLPELESIHEGVVRHVTHTYHDDQGFEHLGGLIREKNLCAEYALRDSVEFALVDQGDDQLAA